MGIEPLAISTWRRDSGWRTRWRCHARAIGALAAAALMLQACGSAGPVPGVYVAENGGAPGWIGEPTGAPVWSPSGDAIAWGGEDGLGIWRGGEEFATPLTTTAMSGRPDWAPDGKGIAFIDRDAIAIAVVDAISGTQTLQIPISQDAGESSVPAIATLGGPAWSPDGARLAFICLDDAGDELCVVNADGRERRQVTKLEPLATDTESADAAPAASNVGPPSWSPDGQSIAVATYPERKGAVGGVFVVDLARGNARRVSPRLPNSEIEWYPDGRSVVFSTTDKGRSDAIRVELADNTVTSLTEDLPAGGSTPSISADGARVSVASGGNIVLLGPGGQMESIANPGLQNGSPVWDPAGDAVAFLSMEDPLLSYD